jgi:hypothetical protein
VLALIAGAYFQALSGPPSLLFNSHGEFGSPFISVSVSLMFFVPGTIDLVMGAIDVVLTAAFLFPAARRGVARSAVAGGLAVVAFLAIASVAFVHVAPLENTGPRYAIAWAAAMVVALLVALPWPRIRI